MNFVKYIIVSKSFKFEEFKLRESNKNINSNFESKIHELRIYYDTS